MDPVNNYEAKTRLSQLIDIAASGDRCVSKSIVEAAQTLHMEALPDAAFEVTAIFA